MTSRTTHTTAVFYPETDGMPMPDAEYQGTMFREIVSTLATYYGDQPTTLVSGNTFIYYEEGNPQRRMAPDCYIIFDANRESIERNYTCLLWEMPGPPAFVLEIGSPSTAQTDLVDKRDLYARLGIGEYWRYDKTGGDFYREPLVGEHLVDGEYHRFDLHREPDGMVWAHSPTINLDLCWDDGRLHIWDPIAGHWLLNQQEEHDGRLAAEEAVRAAEVRRQAAEERAERLKARLRELEDRQG